MNKRWYAVYVRERRTHPEYISAEQHRQLSENVQRHGDHARVGGRPPRAARLRALRGITVLVVGRPMRHGFVSRVAPSSVHKLLERGRGFDIDIDIVDV
jgi:hypothetical protein